MVIYGTLWLHSIFKKLQVVQREEHTYFEDTYILRSYLSKKNGHIV